MKISVIVPIKNGEPFLKECIEGLLAQKIDHELEVVVIDSGSTDRSLEIVGSYPVRLIRIAPYEFNHGDTRNLGAAETDGDLIVFFVQDAVPADDQWLARLTGNLLNDETVAGAFSRIIPRPDCGPLVERGVRGDLNFGSERIEATYETPFVPETWDPHTRRIRSNFNDVASVLRRSVWEEIPYQRTPFGEDISWADSAMRAGHKIVFDPTSVVIHSHEYQPLSIYPRTHIDGWFNQAYFKRTIIEKPFHVLIMTKRQFKEDRVFLRDKGLTGFRKWKETVSSLVYHFFEFAGFYMGGNRKGELPKHWPVREKSFELFLAISRHAAADDREIRDALEMAGHFDELGFKVRFLRERAADEDGGPAGEATFDRFPVLDVRAGNETPSRPYQDLDNVLDKLVVPQGPAVVHCLDFSPFTAGVLDFCRKRRIPCLVSLNDFWFRCPRADLVRSDNTYCAAKKPPRMGCALCRAQQAEFIFPALWIDKIMGKAVAFLGMGGMNGTRSGVSGRAPEEGLETARMLDPLTRTERLVNLLRGAQFVIVPNAFFLARCRELGLNGMRIVSMGGKEPPTRLDRLASVLAETRDRDGFDAGAWDRLEPDRAARMLTVKYRQALCRAAYEREAENHRKATDQHVE